MRITLDVDDGDTFHLRRAVVRAAEDFELMARAVSPKASQRWKERADRFRHYAHQIKVQGRSQ